MNNTVAVEFRGLSKAYGDCHASRELDLSVKAGTIHAIIGENGAGKSTAMKMLYGLIKPDSGEIKIRGEAKRWRSPRDAIACGIGMVHQHFMLAGTDTVLDNILLGDEPSRFRWLPRAFRPIDRAGARAELSKIAGGFLRLEWDDRVEDLSVGVQQRIEILKLLYRKASILILDEPTAVLTPQETHELFDYLKKLKAEGKTILVITHKLSEVMGFADEVTVFRQARVIGTKKVSETNADELASLMVGRKIRLDADAPPAVVLGAPVLSVKNLTVASTRAEHKPVVNDVSFEVRAGEIVGIAGVEGNGQSQLLQYLAHSAPRESLGVVPEDRHLEGLLLDRPMTESYLLGLQRAFQRGGILQEKALARAVEKAIAEYDIRPPTPQLDARRFSGGNQQKLIIAREFSRGAKFMLVAQPTRGVDVGAIETIHARILRARAEGCGILLVSSELDEIMRLSDRILVMYDGKFVAEFPRAEATEEKLGLYMGGGHL